ncbi:hypothetical protein BGW80DRAFT_188400 [Lactifluus volemus]|nr:hypothetical protein BGW80DRAFT_188400 [Lactifluus volemus]
MRTGLPSEMYADSLMDMSPAILRPVGHGPTNRRGGASLKDGGHEQESGSRVCTLTRTSSSLIEFEKSQKQPNRVVRILIIKSLIVP